MKFGHLKSKIESILIEAYQSNNFDTQIKIFNMLVLENKKVSKLFYLYDELSSKKGFKDKELANDFINESIKIYENTINKVKESDFNRIIYWTNKVKTNNNYETIDNLFENNLVNLENKIKSRKVILENLSKESKEINNDINLPIKTLVNVANQTIEKYIDKLDENTKTELKNILLSDDTKLESDYKNIKEEVLTKLNNLKTNSDIETKNKIDESIQKIKTEKFDKLNLYRLKSLNESI